MSRPNSALIYWQSFAAMPTLDAEQSKKFGVAARLDIGPVDGDLKPIVDQYGIALAELQRAGKIPHCDWQLDYEAGPGLLLPHLDKARELSRAALFRARLRFAAGNTDGAIADLLATFKLARDCGGSPLLTSLMVAAAIERSTIAVTAANLPRLSPDQLSQLADALEKLPQSASLADGLRMEAQSFGNCMGHLIDTEAAKVNDPKAGAAVLAAITRSLGLNDDGPDPNVAEAQRRQKLMQTMTVADVRGMHKRLLVDYEEMAKIASLDDAEQPGRWAAFEARLSESRKLPDRDALQRTFSVALLPLLEGINGRAVQIRVLRNLLQLSVQVQRDGPDAVQKALTKAGIKHASTRTGFELRYVYPGSEETEVIHVGSTVPAESDASSP